MIPRVAHGNVWAMANTIAMLQIAANRFAQMGGFSPIAVDGVMGPATAAAVHAALSVIQGDVPDEADNAATLNSTLDQAQMVQSASGLTTYLNQNADTLNLSSGTAVPVGSSLSPTPGLPDSPFSANLSVMWANLPLPAKIGGGLLAVAGLVMLAKHLAGNKKKRGRALHGVNLDDESTETVEEPEFDEAEEG